MDTPSPRKAAKAATRALVIAGARSLFKSLPYEDVTIRLVARTIGRSTGAVFSCVEDKADLWRQAMGTTADLRVIAPMRELLQAVRIHVGDDQLLARIDALVLAANGDGPVPEPAAEPAAAQADEAA